MKVKSTGNRNGSKKEEDGSTRPKTKVEMGKKLILNNNDCICTIMNKIKEPTLKNVLYFQHLICQISAKLKKLFFHSLQSLSSVQILQTKKRGEEKSVKQRKKQVRVRKATEGKIFKKG